MNMDFSRFQIAENGMPGVPHFICRLCSLNGWWLSLPSIAKNSNVPLQMFQKDPNELRRVPEDWLYDWYIRLPSGKLT